MKLTLHDSALNKEATLHGGAPMTNPYQRGSAPGREQPDFLRKASFKTGHEKKGGRKRGTPNAFSADYKRALVEAAYRVGLPVELAEGSTREDPQPIEKTSTSAFVTTSASFASNGPSADPFVAMAAAIGRDSLFRSMP